MLPVAIRDRLHELSGAELKVLLSYMAHADQRGIAWPSRELLVRETGLSVAWISRARASLTRSGWLIPVGVHHGGKFSAPRYQPTIPPPCSTKCVTEKVRHGESPSREKDTHRVAQSDKVRDAQKTLEVNPYEETPRKKPTRQNGQLATIELPSNLDLGKGRVAWLTVLEAAQKQVDHRKFDTWFRPARPVGVSDDGTLYVSVRHSDFAWHLEIEYKDEIAEMLGKIGLRRLKCVIADDYKIRAVPAASSIAAEVV